MLLHIFGDTHGPLEINKINPKRFLGRALTDNDAIVICGDFGFPFMPTDCISEDALKESGAEHYCIKYARAYRQNIDWLKTFPCNILFVDGNHDNHEFWAKLPTESGTAVEFRDCRTRPMSSTLCAANTIQSMA